MQHEPWKAGEIVLAPESIDWKLIQDNTDFITYSNLDLPEVADTTVKVVDDILERLMHHE